MVYYINNTTYIKKKSSEFKDQIDYILLFDKKKIWLYYVLDEKVRDKEKEVEDYFEKYLEKLLESAFKSTKICTLNLFTSSDNWEVIEKYLLNNHIVFDCEDSIKM